MGKAQSLSVQTPYLSFLALKEKTESLEIFLSAEK